MNPGMKMRVKVRRPLTGCLWKQVKVGARSSEQMLLVNMWPLGRLELNGFILWNHNEK